MKNELIGKIQTRQSIRKYSNEAISENDLTEILKTGFSAPSAGNRQPWRVVIVKDKTRKDRLATAAYGQSFIQLKDTMKEVRHYMRYKTRQH